MGNRLKKAEILLEGVRGKKLTREERVEKTIELAAFLLEAALLEKTREEKKKEAWLARMVEDPKGRAFMTAMTDQCFRSHSPERTADQLVYLIHQYGIPQFLNESDKLKFFILKLLGESFPRILIPQVKKSIRREMAEVLLPEDPKQQLAYFKKCWKNHIRINLNHLGEAILGEKESENRLRIYLRDLKSPHIEYISIKISTIYSQINMVGFDNTLEKLSQRLRILYRQAQNNCFRRVDGSEVAKFVNLDMEEYKDLDLTIALFQTVLNEPEFFTYQAGIVLQSYLPDSFERQKILTKWAQERVKQGGAPIKIRIVKGANLAMEAVESSIRGWNQAPFETKLESDANFKKMVEFACLKENATAAQIGIGSHNLLDIAYTLLLRSENETEEFIGFEMLEGMAKPMRRVVQQLSGSMLLYCPEAKEKDFQNAVAYLIRRLDENSGEENFLRRFFEIRPGNTVWKGVCSQFKKSCDLIDSLPLEKKRRQNRLLSTLEPFLLEAFKNEPDTDFSLQENRKWAESIFADWENKKHADIPLVIDNEEVFSLLESGIDPSNPGKTLYRYSLADVPLIEKALTCAESAKIAWEELPFMERSSILASVANVFRQKRNEMIGAMIADGGKTVWEADPEVSEAVDFLEYYRKIWEKQLAFSDLQWRAKGIVLVTPPWNFPCSIPVGGIAAALTAGNSVLFKPAPEAVLIGWEVVKAFWEGGVPRSVLQFINCKEEPVGSYLIKHPKISSVILTGGTQTALKFLKIKPGIDLHAETGGKNAIIVTAMSDRDLAIRDIIQSAFGHSGQKCSACSLAIVEGEVYDDPQFKKQLLDAAKSLTVDGAWNKNAKITPMIRPPEGALQRALTTLEKGESWLLEPEADAKNPHLWSPAIKWDVAENSYTHQTEFFGPLLSVMRADDLVSAIRMANGTPYGLTSGLHSLDEREHHVWKEKIQAGNLYINRGITGAIVQRQPFGGCKASSFGTGAKAGGPHYVQQFAHPLEVKLPEEKAPLPASMAPIISLLPSFKLSEQEEEIWKRSMENYAYWAKQLTKPIDFAPVIGEENTFYLVPLDKIHVRVEDETVTLPLLQVIGACLICETPLQISTQVRLPLQGMDVRVEEESELLQRQPSRIRLLTSPSAALQQGAAEKGIILLREPVLPHGRIELLHYLREVALSYSYHRYGYLGIH